MVAYLVLVGGTFAAYLLNYFQRRKRHFLCENKKYEIIFFFAFFILMLAFRASSVGADTARYILLYEKTRAASFGSIFRDDVELGYRVAEKILSYVIKNPQLYLAIHAAATVIPIAYLYYKESELPLLELTMFMVLPVFHMAFTGLRQMVAIAFTVPVFYAVKERKLVRFLILVVIAYFFHQSAFILFLLYPIYHLSAKVASLAVIAPSLVFVYFYNAVLYKWLMRLVPERFVERYDNVWDTGGYSVLIMFVLMVVLCFFLIRTKNLDKETLGLRNVLVLSALLQCFVPINGFAMRINFYFIVLVPLAVSRIINRADEDKKPFAVIACIVLVAFFLFNFFYKGFKGQDGFMIFPYKTIFGW